MRLYVAEPENACDPAHVFIVEGCSCLQQYALSKEYSIYKHVLVSCANDVI